MRQRLVVGDVGTVALGATIPAGEEVVEGDPVARYAELADLAVSGDDAEVGVWEMTAGCVRDVEADEIFVVLSGRGTLRFADGEAIDLRPGALVRLHAGERTEWRVHETLRKLYFSI